METRTLTVRVTGPLAGYAEGFAAELQGRRYTEMSTRKQLHLFSQLSRWLERTGIEPAELTDSQVSSFLRTRMEAAPAGPRTERALGAMLGYLRRLGAVPEPQIAIQEGPVEALLERYRRYLVRERGLMATTVARYEGVAGLFLDGVGTTGDELDLSGLTTVTVTRFVLRQSQRLGVGSAKKMVTGLGSLLRFLHLEGMAPPLAAVVPRVAGWGVASLPRALEPEQVAALLASCDLSSTVGRRDHTMITLLARLGLRGREVAALELDDFDWRQGHVVIRGKGGRQDALPLPVDVGEAVSSYIKSARVQVQSRRLFLRVLAPLDVELTANSVKEAVKQLELGPPFLPAEIQGRWHGLVDANVVAHGKEIRNVNWQKATGSSRVTVWATTVLLDELDRLAYDQRSSPSADRVRVFNRWLRPLLQDTLAPGGYALPGAADTRLRVWVAPVVLGPPDERHLGAAEELLERGVPIKVITGDNGMAARAMSRGLDTFDPTNDILLTPGQGAAASP